jgi:hypothetical protein
MRIGPPPHKASGFQTGDSIVCQPIGTVLFSFLNIQPYGVFEAQAFGKPAGTSVRMTYYTADEKGTLQPSEEVEELLWIQSDFARDKMTVTGLMILDDLKQKNRID